MNWTTSIRFALWQLCPNRCKQCLKWNKNKINIKGWNWSRMKSVKSLNTLEKMQVDQLTLHFEFSRYRWRCLFWDCHNQAVLARLFDPLNLMLPSKLDPPLNLHFEDPFSQLPSRWQRFQRWYFFWLGIAESVYKANIE